MENKSKETRNKRILALIAILVIGFAYMVSGQEAKFKVLSSEVISITIDGYAFDNIEDADVAKLDSMGNFVYFNFKTLLINDNNIMMSMENSQITYSQDVPFMLVVKEKSGPNDKYFDFNGKELVNILKEIGD
jgi:hypothetical protein